jgi:hypothetical protein
MQILKLIFLPYFGLGLFTGVVVVVARSGQTPLTPKVFVILALIHVLLLGFGHLLAVKSKTDRQLQFGLSAAGLRVGLVLAYLAGFLIAVFAL